MMYSETSHTWPQKTLTGYEGTLILKVRIDRQNYDSKVHADESHSKPEASGICYKEQDILIAQQVKIAV